VSLSSGICCEASILACVLNPSPFRLSEILDWTQAHEYLIEQESSPKVEPHLSLARLSVKTSRYSTDIYDRTYQFHGLFGVASEAMNNSTVPTNCPPAVLSETFLSQDSDEIGMGCTGVQK
jgi:hypothetical protein